MGGSTPVAKAQGDHHVHGHGDHGPPYVIPDYKIFKIDGIPQLEQLRDALAQKGLHDPWIRNEAWRYHPGFGTRWQRSKSFFFRGLFIGIALTALHVTYDKMVGGGHDHGHGHEHGDDHKC
ncbi:NADH dehydrogenase 1 beta subcomplex subunit 3 [Eumeta japonica]|uniref:NADH dehydrogenase [ubiquinone] 1 beta subcomplex subunit 3 n=1 Tax=Eumeta variegata TaxID=151549 RepID=A0A4C2AF13_EUMVA|nr:NADH dehydrogenase 1 beta subcomplex subunit 3 [Eumeta japonica]